LKTWLAPLAAGAILDREPSPQPDFERRMAA